MSTPAAFHTVRLGRSALRVTPICLGTMTFGSQVTEADAHGILDRALDAGINFLDTAEMYPVPARAETFGVTEQIVGNWLASRPGARSRLVLATKVSGPVRGMPWIRDGSPDLTPADIIAACDASLKRLRTDYIDLYQIHWPNRNAPSFGNIYYDPAKDGDNSSIHLQLEALTSLVRSGKIREFGLSNETPYGLSEFLRIADQQGLPRVASVQNPYCLINRAVDNGLDELMYHQQVGLLAYSPLGFGLLTGKYDERGLEDPARPGRLAIFETMKKQRWGRPEALAAARRYNALAREHGLSPTAMAMAFCTTNWRVASTIIGVTSAAQLDELIATWGQRLEPALLAAIDAIRWQARDPAQ